MAPNPLSAHRWLARAALVLLFAASLTAVVSGVAGAESPSPPTEKIVLRGGWTDDPDSLNPFLGYASSSYEIWRLNYDQLTGWDTATMGPAPEIAESWTVSEDSLVWEFKIRQGVKWQDGRPLTARDVAFTYNYIIQNELGAKIAYTESIARVETPDDYTVRFVCSEPKTDMLGAQIPILPEHIWSGVSGEEAETSYANDPPIIGSGPFQVVEVKNDEYVRMEANKDYWGGAPTIDEIIFQTYQNADTMAQDMRLGALDMAWNLPDAQVEGLDELENILAHHYVTRGMVELGFNCYESPDSKGHPVLLDVGFRRALSYAVDREKINEIAYGGHGVPGLSIILPGWYSAPDWHWQPPEAYAFDLDAARAALEAAGYTDTDGDGVREYDGEPIALRLWAMSESVAQQAAARLIAGWLKDCGLRVTFEVMSEGAMTDRMYSYEGDTFAPDYDLFVWNWIGDVDPDFILSVFTSGQIESWSDCNWSNEEYDRLYLQQKQAVDPDERKRIIDRMQEIFYDECPYIVLVYPSSSEAYNVTEWKGWVRSPGESGAVWYTGFNRDSYLALEPERAESDSGGSAGWILGGLLVAAAVVGVVVVILVRRRSGVREEV